MDQDFNDPPPLNLPPSFPERIAQDISIKTWVQVLQENHSLRERLLEGFSSRPGKLAGFVRQPQFIVRLRRLVQSDRNALQFLLELWAQEQLSMLAFLEMLDRTFLLENWNNLKNLLGPERFFACLTLLDYSREAEIRDKIVGEFWDRQIEPEAIEPLIPVLNLWKRFVEQFPQAHDWVEGLLTPSPTHAGVPGALTDQRLCEISQREEERRRKLEEKLEKVQEERSRIEQDLARARKENEELRRKAAESDQSFALRLEEALARQRLEWFQRYQSPGEERLLEYADKHLDTLLKQADRAFELQREADEQYGRVSTVRQKLLHAELYLKEIERIYSESLVVHSELARVKEALQQEKKRLLQLPGIEKVLRQEPQLLSVEDLRTRVRLLEALPENLPKVAQLQKLLSRLASLGFVTHTQPLQEAIHQKKRQIMEVLYAYFKPPARAAGRNQAFRSLEDFVRSGLSRNYDVYVDGYNILLKVQGQNRTKLGPSLAAFREEFITAVVEKGAHFRKIYLVFDGIEDFRDRRGNVDIIYSNKTLGITADMVIIDAIKKRNDRQMLLVTADNEIIRATEARVFATIDPYYFYTFIFGMMSDEALE